MKNYITKNQAKDLIREGWPDEVTLHDRSAFDILMNNIDQDEGKDMAYYDIEDDEIYYGWYPSVGKRLEADPNVIVFFA